MISLGHIQGGPHPSEAPQTPLFSNAQDPADKCTKLLWCKGDIRTKNNGVMTFFFALHLTLGRRMGRYLWGGFADVLTFFSLYLI